MAQNPIPNRTPVVNGANGEMSFPWLTWLRSIVANVPLSGSGSPEGVVTANVGTLYTRTDGSASTTLYVKESGIAAVGWVAK